MKLELKLPLTDEQQNLVDEIDRLNTLASALGGPIPFGADEAVIQDLGRFRVADIERQELQRIEVLRWALERRLADLEAAKG